MPPYQPFNFAPDCAKALPALARANTPAARITFKRIAISPIALLMNVICYYCGAEYTCGFGAGAKWSANKPGNVARVQHQERTLVSNATA
jgi:hypothetical protein